MYSRIKNAFAKLKEKPYDAEKYVIALVILSFIKISVFSLGIEAPEVEWDWRFLTVVVFIVANVSILLVLYSPVFLIKRRMSQVIYGLVINFLLTWIIVINRIYYMFFHSYITLDTVAHSTEGLSMIQAVYSTIRMGEFLWFIDLIILYLIFARQPVSSDISVRKFFGFRKEERDKSQGTQLSRLMRVCVIVSITILLWTPIMSIYTVSGEMHHNIQLREAGPLMFYTREAAAQTAIVEEREIGVGEKHQIESWFNERKIAKEEEKKERLTGEFKDKNLILLQIEALQNVAINKQINGQEITPNINRIIEDSLFFQNTYDQTDMATADAEALVNFSLYPPGNVSAYMQYTENNFNSLPRTLKEEGYITAAFHGFEKDFYNRNKAYPNVGYEMFFSQENYKLDEVYNGLLGDKTFLKQTVDHLKGLEEPYFAFVITLTSHHPFNYIQPEDYEEIDVGEYEDTIVGDYIRSIHYTDAAVGEFYQELKKEGILEDTVLALYGDHAAFNYNERDYEELNEFFGVDNIHRPEEQMKVHKVPFAIYDSNGKIEYTMEERMGMIDIFPTLINIMGVDNPYTMGKDILNSEKELIIFRDGSFITEDYYFVVKEEEFYDLNSGESVEMKEEDVEDMRARVERKLEISDLIYKTDYFRQGD